MHYDLPFEQPLQDIVKQIEDIKKRKSGITLEDLEQIRQLQGDLDRRKQEIYSHLTSWQIVQIARHKDRPYTADYIRLLCQDFFELHGDRAYADDPAIIAGIGRIKDQTFMVLGHQKGRTIAEKQNSNFGMPHPEGYRKAYRIMQQAERFGFPLLCLIDTPGAFPGLDDEARGQSEVIAANLTLMAQLRTPIIAVVIGEGGSGGALAISVADRLLMLKYSIYTVASPEAAASILWRDTAFAAQAAEKMRICAHDLLETGIIDEVIDEPGGGAHHNPELVATLVEAALLRHLTELQPCSVEELIERRYQKFRTIGPFE